MPAYRETFRRHRVLYLAPALVAALALGVLGYKAPTYMSTASLWVDNEASSSSSLNVTPNTNQAVTPSSAEQVVLNELLATNKFDDAVIAGAGLGHADANSPLLSGVTSATPGPQVLQVTCIGPSPTVAQQIVKSVITQLQTFSQKWAHDFASSAVAYYQAQVDSASRAAAQAKTSSASSQNPALGAATSALATASSALSQAQAQANDNNGFSTVMVLGAPTSNPAALTGYKSLLMKALGAGAAALLLSALVIVVRTSGGHDKWDDEMSDPRSSADGWAPPRAVTDAGAVDVRAPMVASAPVPPSEPAAQSLVSHPLRRSGLLLRKTVTHQPSDGEPDPPAAAEGGRA
jgi:hypothetical protein